MKDKKESVYFSNQRAPLGKSHDQTPGLPKGLDILNTTFGTAIVRGSENKGWDGVIKCFLRKWDSVSCRGLFSAGADDVKNEKQDHSKKVTLRPRGLRVCQGRVFRPWVQGLERRFRAQSRDGADTGNRLRNADAGTSCEGCHPSSWAPTDGFYFHQGLWYARNSQLFFKIFFLNWRTVDVQMFCWFLLYSKLIRLCMYIHSFLCSFPLCFTPGAWI